MHTKFKVYAGGNTPMDAALWWVLRQLYFLPEPRKLIVLITDGMPSDLSATKKAVRAIMDFGMEIYGIGIATDALDSFLSGKQHRNITNMDELAPAMFEVLQNSLLAGRL
jgi:cobalamin biosynthesis protein CobT